MALMASTLAGSCATRAFVDLGSGAPTSPQAVEAPLRPVATVLEGDPAEAEPEPGAEPAHAPHDRHAPRHEPEDHGHAH